MSSPFRHKAMLMLLELPHAPRRGGLRCMHTLTSNYAQQQGQFLQKTLLGRGEYYFIVLYEEV